jgi:hypothetical protein
MNERIKALAEQAGYLPDMFNRGHWDLPECHKFAELIIQDCISQIALIGLSNIENEDIAWTAEHSIKSIKEHFGIT